MKRFSGMALIFVISLVMISCHLVQSDSQKKSSINETTIRWVTPVVQAPGLNHRTFYSSAANSEVSYHIYIPELYYMDQKRRFPVLLWLHGHGGGLKGLPHLVEHFDSAIRSGKIPPMLIVFPNGMAESMWCDSKDGRVPMETVVVKELLPHIDATYRTIVSGKNRLIEGFSMGGYGAARLGFKYPEFFSAVSMIGAGPLQEEFIPSEGPPEMARFRARVLQNVYGGDQEYFKEESPRLIAKQNKAAISENMRVRQIIGGQDETLIYNEEFSTYLDHLGIPHDFRVLPGITHDTMLLFNALGDSNWGFYRAVFTVEIPIDALDSEIRK